MADRPPKRKRIRLNAPLYASQGTRVMVTCGVQVRRPVFADTALATSFVDILREQSERDQVGILAFCLMPDHLHLFVQVDGDVDVVRFMQAVMGKSTNLSWNYGLTGQLWQRSFYDHVLRESEDEDEHIRYILGNSVRAGPVETWNDYPFSGSIAYDLADGL